MKEDVGKDINWPYSYPRFTMIGLFERIGKWLACTFGFHQWDHQDGMADPSEFEVHRVCDRCGRVEMLHMGHWVPLRRIKLVVSVDK